MSLKTKGSSRKTEALILIGGGETYSELLIGADANSSWFYQVF